MRHGLCLLLLLTACQAGIAQIPDRLLPQAAARLLEQDRPALTAPWRAFHARTGWQAADWDRFHAYPHRAFGSGLALPGGVIKDAQDLDQRLKTFLAGHPDLLSGGADGGAEHLKVAQLARHGRLWYASYQQTWRGHRVEQAELEFRVTTEGRLVLAGSDLHPVIDAREPRIGALEAARLCAAQAGAAVREATTEPDWVLLPLLGPRGFQFRSAWPCRVRMADPQVVTRVFIDGETGEALWAWNEVRHITLEGQVQGLVEEQQPSDPDAAHPLQHLRLELDGQEFFSDAQGNFSVEASGPGPWDIEGECFGRFADVDRQDGADAAFTLSMSASGQTLTVELDQAQVEELDAFHHTNRVHDFITDMDPSFTGLDEPLTVRVNINQTCNAYWDGNSINFFMEGGGCPNTGRVAGVVYHEYGHGINDRQYMQAGSPWGMTNGAMHEGLADVTAIYLQDESYVSPGWFIRNLDNGRHYPEDIQGEVHYDGEIIGGAMYDMRQAVGLETARPLHHFARWGTPDDPDLGRAAFEYFIEILLVDDDDGDLANLTPNFDAINDAFNAHGVGTDLTWMGTDFTLDEPPFIVPPLQPLPVRAVLTAPAFVTPQAVEVLYWRGDEAPQTMQLTEQEDGAWTGELPGQVWNTVLKYYARVINDAGVEILSPPGAPEQVYRTRFVWSAGLTESFELEPGGEALNEVWQWGAPQDGPGAAEDGQYCWGTNLTGNYPDMSLARLVLDEQEVSDDDQVIVGFRHWMAVEEGWDGVNVEMSLDGSEDWTLITPLSGYDFNTPDNNVLPFEPALTGFTDGWESLTFDLTDMTQPGDRVRLRLNLFTDTAVTEAGWYVDYLEYLGFSSPPQIQHTPLGDSEDGAQALFPVAAVLDLPSPVARFDLIWRVDGGAAQTLAMADQGDHWQADIPGPFWDQTVEYRLEAEADGGFTGFLPENPEAWFAFRVGTDQTPPVIVFQAAPTDAVGWSALWRVEALASDNLDAPLDAVWLEWRPEGGSWLPLSDLLPTGDDLWSAQVDFQPAGAPAAVEFRAVARDASAAQLESATSAVAVALGSQQAMDDFEDPLLPGWQIEGVFGAQQSRVHAGAFSLGTGDDGFYEPLAAGRATLEANLDLRLVTDPALVLWECWFLESGDDEAWIEVSGDGGEDWDLLATRTGGHAWVENRISLAAYAGSSQVRLRFGFQADGDNDGLHIGYFVDDLRVINNSGLSVMAPVAIPDGLELGEPWPNPFNPVCRVDVRTQGAEALRLALYNLMGQEVAVIFVGTLPEGRRSFTVDGRGLASGLYLLSAVQGERREIRRLLLVR